MDLTQQLADGHGWLGYLVFLVVLVSVGRAAMQARAGAPYSDGLPRLAGLLLPLQLVYGIVVYVQVDGWNFGTGIAYIHPVAMLGAVALAGISTARARKAEDDAASWGAIARFQGIALLLVLVGIGAASM